MASLAARYRDGEHVEVWRELDHRWLTRIRFEGVDLTRPTEDEIEDILSETFSRVARNVDRLIQRLTETGYRFECESGRYREATQPRHPCQNWDRAELEAILGSRLSVLASIGERHVGVPPSFDGFARHVGTVDLTQRNPAYDRPDLNTALNEYQGHLVSGTKDESLAAQLANLFEPLRKPPHPAQEAWNQKMDSDDRIPHPHAEDPILSRLGDWDPLVVEPEYFVADLKNTDWMLSNVPDGGLGFMAEFAPSFEHKADVSGAVNWHIYLPSDRFDATVFAEGVRMPFIDYLRTIFARGGFFGVPRPIRIDGPESRMVQDGILLPDHPIFASLATDMEPF